MRIDKASVDESCTGRDVRSPGSNPGSLNQKTRPLHHGGTESRRKAKDRWVRAGPMGFRRVQNQGFDISPSPLHRKMECTELCRVAPLAMKRLLAGREITWGLHTLNRIAEFTV